MWKARKASWTNPTESSQRKVSLADSWRFLWKSSVCYSTVASSWVGPIQAGHDEVVAMIAAVWDLSLDVGSPRGCLMCVQYANVFRILETIRWMYVLCWDEHDCFWPKAMSDDLLEEIFVSWRCYSQIIICSALHEPRHSRLENWPITEVDDDGPKLSPAVNHDMSDEMEVGCFSWDDFCWFSAESRVFYLQLLKMLCLEYLVQGWSLGL